MSVHHVEVQEERMDGLHGGKVCCGEVLALIQQEKGGLKAHLLRKIDVAGETANASEAEGCR